MGFNIRSGIHKRYEKAFKLDADTLQRITGLLEKYREELRCPNSIVFYVEREDNRYYETTEIENVLEDPNIDKKEIYYLSVDIRNSDPERRPQPWDRDFIVRINFHKVRKTKVGIWIEAEDRTWALLLADELQPQVERSFKCTQIPNWLLVLFYISLGSLVTIWLPRITGIHYVLDVLAENLALFLWPGIGIFCYLTYKSKRPKWLAKIVGPEPVFLWGDQAEEYEKRERRRTNILWSVIITFAVSILANIATNFFIR